MKSPKYFSKSGYVANFIFLEIFRSYLWIKFVLVLNYYFKDKSESRILNQGSFRKLLSSWPHHHLVAALTQVFTDKVLPLQQDEQLRLVGSYCPSLWRGGLPQAERELQLVLQRKPFIIPSVWPLRAGFFVEHELNRSVAMLRQLHVFQQIRAIITFSNSQSIGGGEELRLHS